MATPKTVTAGFLDADIEDLDIPEPKKLPREPLKVRANHAQVRPSSDVVPPIVRGLGVILATHHLGSHRSEIRKYVDDTALDTVIAKLIMIREG